jgi:Protein of unknown function (DUF1676)
VLFDKFIQARNAKADDVALTMLVADKLWTFVKSRALRWKMSDSADVIVSAGAHGKINLGISVDAKQAFIEGRGKMKNSGPLIAAVVLKGALLGILAFKALFLLSGKALLVSKLSLLLASLIGVKKLLNHKPKVRVVKFGTFSESLKCFFYSQHVTYEIVNDHHRYDNFNKQPVSPANPSQQQQPAGWQRGFDLENMFSITLDSFIENFANKFSS